jgi:hypothetical protein
MIFLVGFVSFLFSSKALRFRVIQFIIGGENEE